MSLNEPSVGQTAGPDWATEVNENFTTIDQHDHTSGKGVQLTPSALNINSDLEFNGNAAIELKRLTFDSSATGSGTNYSVYQSGGNLYWYNGSGQAVQITNGANVKTTGGSIDGMGGTDAQVLYGSGIYRFEFDTTLSPFSGAKMAHGDILLYKYDGSSGSDAYVTLKYTGSSAGSNNITVPDETGTMLTTSTSFGGNISIAATGGSNTITLDAEGDINLDSNSGVLTFKDNGTAIGKISNSSSDLVIENEVDAKDIIFKQYDGNEVVRMAHDRRLYFFDKGGEYLVGDGTDLTVASGGAINLTATTDVVVPANVGVTFGTGEKIEGDNTDLTLTSGADINLTATADVNLPNNVGLVFGDDGEKIEGDGTDLTIASSGEINVNSGTLDLSAQTVNVTLNNAVDALNFDSNTFSIDASNNRIGIGTAAPEQALDMGAGQIRLDNTKFIYWDDAGGTLRNGIRRNSNEMEYWSHPTNSGGQGTHLFKVGITGGSTIDALKIDSSGNVGIGTDNPAPGLGGSDVTLEIKGDTSPSLTINDTGQAEKYSLFADSNDFKIGYGTTVLATFQNDGKVGIGDTSPSYKFTCDAGNVADTACKIIQYGGYAGFIVEADSSNTGTAMMRVSSTGGGDATFQYTVDGSNKWNVSVDNSESNDPLNFYDYTSATNVMTLVNGRMFTSSTISAGGGVYVSTTGTGGDRKLSSASSLTNPITLYWGNEKLFTASDRRLKQNIVDTEINGLEKINALRIRDFQWNDPSDVGDDYNKRGQWTGMVAQEIIDVLPFTINAPRDSESNPIEDAVSEEDNQIIPWIVNYGYMVPVLVKAIQELSAKVTALEGA